jgi:hypothetical protein
VDGEWHTVSLPVRADIFEKTTQQGVEVSELCNRALAAAVGIDYDQREKDRIAARKPVIVAKDSAAALPPAISPALPAPGPAGHLHPVINADDPGAVSSVKKTKRTPAVKPAAPAPVPLPSPAAPVLSVTAGKTPIPKKGKSTPKKRGAGPDLRKFVAETILRDDTGNASITKEALYQAFARWCREHRIPTMPDRKALTVALKNQFAFSEEMVDGEPSWVNARLI